MEDPFARLYARVHAIQKTVTNLPGAMVLLEDARKVSRLARRVEVLVVDLQPYVQPHPGARPAPQFQTVLEEIEGQLAVMHDTVNAMAIKGPLASLMQGDRLLDTLQSAAASLCAALDSIKGRLPEETSEELASVKGLLQRAHFEMTPEHKATMAQFRAGVSSMTAAHAQIMGACSGILVAMNGGLGQLSKEAFEVALAELNNEHVSVVSQGDPHGDSINLRVMMDVLRMKQRTEGPPLEFICPLTRQMMRDPVVLRETGHSYERMAIEDWYNRGQRMCPRTGKPLGVFKLRVVPNTNLKEAIENWKLFGALSVSWNEQQGGQSGTLDPTRDVGNLAAGPSTPGASTPQATAPELPAAAAAAPAQQVAGPSTPGAADAAGTSPAPSAAAVQPLAASGAFFQEPAAPIDPAASLAGAAVLSNWSSVSSPSALADANLDWGEVTNRPSIGGGHALAPSAMRASMSGNRSNSMHVAGAGENGLESLPGKSSGRLSDAGEERGTNVFLQNGTAGESQQASTELLAGLDA